MSFDYEAETSTITAEGFSFEFGGDLLKEFLRTAGIQPSDELTVHNPIINPKDRSPGPGFHLYMNWSDFSIAVFQNGKPFAGFYESSRGSLYQAGAYFHKARAYYYAHNFRDGPKDTWLVASRETDFCCLIAEEWLLGTRMFG